MAHDPTKIQGYRALSDEEIALMNEVKTQGEMLKRLIERLESRARTQGDVDGRCVSIARTELQTGLMWLARSIARPTGF